ncbi:phage uncharacterized protein, XkdX family [Paenibacillaceae bacterium GAS479]|nr:phage uncharacterized protein, XkdX family [Paenibacillaceae bacterium GAS479]
MDWYFTIKRYYDLGCYTAAQVLRFAELGKLTLDQAGQITGARNEQ